MKKLSFGIKPNMNKPPRIHVQSADKKTTYGAFPSNDCLQFNNWEQLSSEETIELKQYMSNLKAIEHYFSTKALCEQKDFRIRLPESFINALSEISLLCHEELISLDIYDPMINAAIQQLKIIASRLPEEKKHRAFESLQKIGLSENKKIDLSLKIQTVFSELLSIHNKSEKLYQKAKSLFNKDKSISPVTIEEIAKGELSTPRWLISCAIDVLIDEKSKILRKIISDDDLLFLWVKPLLNNDRHALAHVLKKITVFDDGILQEKIKEESRLLDKKNQE